MRRLLSFFSNDIAIDLGTSNTLVFTAGQGVVLSEPSIVAINKNNNKIVAVGTEAKEMLGRTPVHIVAVRPLKDGVIADFDVAEKMISYFIRRVNKGRIWVRPRIVIGVPSGITQVEERAVRDTAYRAKAVEVYLIEEAMAAAIGAGLPIMEPSGNMVVDVGGGTTDVAVISMGGIVYSRSIRLGGTTMDEAIISYMKQNYSLLIGDRTAENIKVNIGSAFPLDEPMTMDIKGRDLIEGKPKRITITDREVREALSEVTSSIVESVRMAFERTPPELSADFIDKGVILTGGGALLRNLDVRLREETGIPIAIAEDPLSACVLGVGRILDDLDLLRQVCLP